ncbi:DUF6889 family protein [Trabulsiella guamensis]|nr:lytic transglycosylase [Trabulsiella guamensis]
MKFGIDQKDLDSGRVDLARIALLNDFMDMEADNQIRFNKWREDNER